MDPVQRLKNISDSCKTITVDHNAPPIRYLYHKKCKFKNIYSTPIISDFSKLSSMT